MSQQTNSGGRVTAIDIIDQVVSIEGLYEKVFGKLLNKLVYDRAIQDDINIIHKMYGMKDIHDLFEVPVDRSEFKDLTKMIFRYQENVKPTIFSGGSSS